MELNKIKVAIIYRYIPQYRQCFYEMLREKLDKIGIELVLIYGQPSQKLALKKDSIDLHWARKVRNLYIKIGRWEFCWQPVLPHIRVVDLIIVESANKLLVNYIFLLLNTLKIKKIAFWGHGKNFQAKKEDRVSEWIKKILTTKVHWWFVYNKLCAEVVKEAGFPFERISSVQNAIDTRNLTVTLQKLSPEELYDARVNINLFSDNIGIYSGGLYPAKRIFFLLESLHYIRKHVPDFEMIFIGDGVDAPLVKDAARNFSWIHYAGPKFNNEKVPFFAISKLLLIPGVVGLGILDAFALETPLVTTNIYGHGPEIEYLENGVNGIMISDANNPQSYADYVVHLIRNPLEYNNLLENCRKSREKYTIENMVEIFSNGIESALKQ